MAIPFGLLQGIERLDPLPVTLQRLVHALDDEHMGPLHIAEIVQYDQAVATTLLRLANSAAYGGWSRTETIGGAIVRLGKARVIDLVLTDHVKQLGVAAPLYDLTEDDLWQHSAAASLAVRALARECPRAGIPESAGVAALVHDVGKLVMVRYLKADVTQILARCSDQHITFVEAERDVFGCDHAEVGGEIARHWQFPEEIQMAIARHHEVPLVDPTPTLDAVVIANLVAKTIGTGLGAEGLNIRLDGACCERLSLDVAAFSRVCIQTLAWLNDLRASYAPRGAAAPIPAP